jgi:DNA-binding NarL/FixJ family response regulator
VAIALFGDVRNAVKGKSAKRLRVLIAEDSGETRKHLRELCSTLPRLHVVGEATNGLEAIEAVRNLKPDVLTLDIHMPKANGLEVLRTIRGQDVPRVVIVLTAFLNIFYRERCKQLMPIHSFDKITEFDRFLELLKSL